MVALIRMWQKSVGLNGNLAKWIGLESGCGKKCGSEWELGKNTSVLIGTM